MRPQRRAIEIFSMSVLDMFASALGAFILIAVILFPYFGRDFTADRARSEQTVTVRSETLKTARERLTALEAKQTPARPSPEGAAACEADRLTCESRAGTTFLMISVDWQEPVGIDLRVTDPQGAVFSWVKTNRGGRDYPKSRAWLSVSVQTGPGLAYWIDPRAAPGAYAVDLTTQHTLDRDVAVSVALFGHAGKTVLPIVVLKAGTNRASVGVATVGADGALVFTP